MVSKKQNNYFNIRNLIMKGKEAVREYELPDGIVLIRPLTDLEFEECEMAMLEEIKDPATRKFAFEASPSQMSNIELEEDVEKQDDYTINYNELIRASTMFLLNIAYFAMRDFTDDFKLEDLKKVNGIKDLALEVQKISGYNENTVAELEEFRTE